MGLFSSDAPLSRAAALDLAAKALAKGRRKKAIAAYRKLLAVDPKDHEVQARIAPLLVDKGERAAAWESFVVAADGYAQKGFLDKAIAVLKMAGKRLPEHVEAWERACALQMKRGRNAEAVQTLIDARALYRRRQERPQAIHLLQKALALEPMRLAPALDLALLLKASGRRDEAKHLLEERLMVARGKDRRRVRRAFFLVAPSPRSLWTWFRS